MKLLELNATGITEIYFDQHPLLELEELFRKNKIKKVTFGKSFAWPGLKNLVISALSNGLV